MLAYAQLPGAGLFEAQLPGANLADAQFHGANLTGAQFHGANLTRAQLHGAMLFEAQLPGADLADAQFHGAYLRAAQLPGAYSNNPRYYGSFEASINERIGKESDLTGAIFAGGLTQEDVDFMCYRLFDLWPASYEAGNELQEKLREHIGKPESNKLPENSGARRGKYTKEAADQWIAAYKTALSAVSESG